MFTKSISLEDKKLFDLYTKSYPYQLSNMNFTTFYMWRDYNKLTYDIIGDYLCVSGSFLDRPFVMPPLTKGIYEEKSLGDTMDFLESCFEKAGHPFILKLLPKNMIPILEIARPDKFKFSLDRDNSDYVYLSEDLRTLRGRKLHSKKNHWNYFVKNIEHQYIPLTSDLTEDCLNLVRRLKGDDYNTYEADLLDSEEKAIQDVLLNMDVLGIQGAAVLVEGKLEAFTFGEQLNCNTMVVHVEKANAQIRGLYQFINQQFCQHECRDVKYVNREEDMGFEFLRKAKKSYNPVKMMEKYDVTLI